MNSTTPQQQEAQEQARLLAIAYLTVFGRDDEHRTDAQRMVMADMKHRGYVNRPIFVPDGNGQVCPIRAAQTEGRRLAVLEVEDFIRRASATEKPKPTVKGKK